MSTGTPLLKVDNLSLDIKHWEKTVVNDLSFEIKAGEVLGIVGESGSGKSLAARAVIGLIPTGVNRKAGSIQLDGEELTTAPEKRMRTIRGSEIGMIFQEPLTSLNPSMKIGRQLAEALTLHRKLDAKARRALILDMLRRVGISEAEEALDAYPHEFSGGMRQRIMIASVMLLKPKLLIADEPTTALDAVVQRDVLELLLALTRENGTAVLLISHDLGMIARYSNRIMVMCKGDMLEAGDTPDVLKRPRHDYTRKLLGAIPQRGPVRAIAGDATPIVSVRDLVVEFAGRRRMLGRNTAKRALKGVSLDVRPGEIVAVVGGSGSGKTTLGQTIAGLVKATSGDILFEGKSIAKGSAAYWEYRLNCQMVFQDPFSSLDPRMRIGKLVAEPLRLVSSMSQAEKKARIAEILDDVGMGEGFADRFVHELSGGQRQRVAIARAVVRRPRFVIADEPVSALDVTVRAQILDLFARLQLKHRFSCLFISHDLGVVEQIADRVVVMREGEIIEAGLRDDVFDHPREDYTRRLLSAVPTLQSSDGGVELLWREPNETVRTDPVSTVA